MTTPPEGSVPPAFRRPLVNDILRNRIAQLGAGLESEQPKPESVQQFLSESVDNLESRTSLEASAVVRNKKQKGRHAHQDPEEVQITYEMEQALLEAAARRARPLFIGLGGKLRSGKDTFADFLVERFGFVKLGMSDALHSFLMAQNPYVVRHFAHEFENFPELPAPTESVPSLGVTLRYRDITEKVGYVRAKEIEEYRRLLQSTGTDAGRNILGEDTWVNAVAKKVTELRDSGSPVVITGIRYQNELDMVGSLDGVSIYIERPSTSIDPVTGAEIETAGAGEKLLRVIDRALDQHSSEVSLDSKDFSTVVVNGTSLEALAAIAENVVVSLVETGRGSYHSVAHPTIFEE